MISNNVGHFVITILVIQISSVNFMFSFADTLHSPVYFFNNLQNFMLFYILFLFFWGEHLYALQI